MALKRIISGKVLPLITGSKYATLVKTRDMSTMSDIVSNAGLNSEAVQKTTTAGKTQ